MIEIRPRGFGHPIARAYHLTVCFGHENQHLRISDKSPDIVIMQLPRANGRVHGSLGLNEFFFELQKHGQVFPKGFSNNDLVHAQHPLVGQMKVDQNGYFCKNIRMHFLSDRLQGYITDHSEDEPEYLRDLSRETHLKVLQPRMITGHYQGRVLSMLSKITAPDRILEIGTYTGYSALCLAEGLRPGGELHTIDINEELQEIQNRFFRLSGFGGQIRQHVGDALEIIPTLDLEFDLVFIDAEKKEYSAYFEAVLPKTRKGGIILSDNVLWSGKVIEPLDPADKATKALLKYNDMLKSDPRVETVMLPVRDGLTLSRVL